MNILIVKLSSLGDVVHAMPAVQDLRRFVPNARIDWVVEKGFAPLVERCEGVTRVIPCELRRWRKKILSAQTRAQWGAFREDLQSQAYDAVIDLQGLTKSALVARVARLAPGGRRIALANRTEGSSYERPTRWAADQAITVQPRVHAVTRSRLLCAQAFGYAVPQALEFGLHGRGVDGQGVELGRPAGVASHAPAARDNTVLLVHGTSRDDKCWPEAHWVQLARRLVEQGHRIALAHGSDEERARSERIAAAVDAGADAGPDAAIADVWPRLTLDILVDRMAQCAGVIGVDSGLSHIAVALDLPHVQIYNFDTAWRTGPFASERARSVFAQPTPTLDAVWQAWRAVTIAGS